MNASTPSGADERRCLASNAARCAESCPKLRYGLRLDTNCGSDGMLRLAEYLTGVQNTRTHAKGAIERDGMENRGPFNAVVLEMHSTP